VTSLFSGSVGTVHRSEGADREGEQRDAPYEQGPSHHGSSKSKIFIAAPGISIEITPAATAESRCKPRTSERIGKSDKRNNGSAETLIVQLY
jgi:hypothetical protein